MISDFILDVKFQEFTSFLIKIITIPFKWALNDDVICAKNAEFFPKYMSGAGIFTFSTSQNMKYRKRPFYKVDLRNCTDRNRQDLYMDFRANLVGGKT